MRRLLMQYELSKRKPNLYKSDDYETSNRQRNHRVLT